MKSSILTIIILIISILTASAAPEAEFKKITKEYTFYPDGSMEFRYYKELKVYSHVAFNKLYGETFIVYNPDFQNINFKTSYTRLADGTIIKTPDNAFNEVLPANAANAPAYNRLKEMVVTHTGLEPDATIFLEYVLSTKPGYYRASDIDEVFQETSPVKEYQLIVNVPVSQPFNYIFTGPGVRPQISENNQVKQYRWTLNNLPAASREAYQPKNLENTPRLTASGYPSQEAALKEFSLEFSGTLDENGEEITRELTKGCKKELDKILAIQQYVVNQIDLCNLSLDETAGKIRPPKDVLRSAYGTLAEKTALFSAMLKVLDLNHEIVVTYPGTLKNAVKGLKPITGLAVQINTGGRPLFLSAARYPSGSLEPRGDRDELWMMKGQKITPLNVIGSVCEINYKANIKITPVKATTAASILVGGGLIPVMDKKAVERHIKSLALPAGNTIISQINSTDTHSARLYFSAEQSLSNTKGGYIIYSLPVAEKGITTWNMKLLNSSRTSAFFEIPYLSKEHYEYELVLSPGTDLETKDKLIQIDKPVGKLRIAIKQSGNSVKVSKEIVFNKTLISPAEYSDFRNIMLTWNDPNVNTLIFKTATDSSGEE